MWNSIYCHNSLICRLTIRYKNNGERRHTKNVIQIYHRCWSRCGCNYHPHRLFLWVASPGGSPSGQNSHRSLDNMNPIQIWRIEISETKMDLCPVMLIPVDTYLTHTNYQSVDLLHPAFTLDTLPQYVNRYYFYSNDCFEITLCFFIFYI